MVARLYVANSSNVFTEVDARLRWTGWEVREQAEEGSVAMSTITLDDPSMDFDVVGHRNAYIVEDTSTGTDDVLWAGFTADQEIAREGGDVIMPLGRVWTLSLTDANTLWQRRIMVGNDNNRPAETDVQRVAWLMTTTEANTFDDVTTFVDSTNGVAMDATDYRWQSLSQIMDDCAQQSGRNWYAFRRKNGANRDLTVWYSHTSNTAYASALSLSNDPDDWTESELVDGTSLVWPISDDSRLRRDPGRVYSGVVLPYDGGTRYKEKASTGTAFARRDVAMPSVNVKSAAKADARALRYLNDLDEQDETITTSVVLPAAIATGIRAGMLVPFKATHFPGYTDFVDCRVLTCTITPMPDGESYRLALELAPPQAVTPPSAVYAVLYVGHGPYDASSRVYFAKPGDTPGPGYPVRPTSANFTVLTNPSPPAADYPYYGWEVASGTGTIDLKWTATTVGVLVDNTAYTVSWAILVNGAVVAAQSEVVSGFLKPYASSATLTATGVSVAPGDIITASLSCNPPTMPFFGCPRGAGQADEWFEITGGSLA